MTAVAEATPKAAVSALSVEKVSHAYGARVALGPANRVAVIDQASKKVVKYLLVGQRVWQLELTPDGKYLLSTNGVSNDVSVIDVAALKVIKSIPVGSFPWGVAISKQ